MESRRLSAQTRPHNKGHCPAHRARATWSPTSSATSTNGRDSSSCRSPNSPDAPPQSSRPR
ncbi:hypothetical protein NKH18_48245 [Streptomyces sp. M10(2022)]